MPEESKQDDVVYYRHPCAMANKILLPKMHSTHQRVTNARETRAAERLQLTEEVDESERPSGRTAVTVRACKNEQPARAQTQETSATPQWANGRLMGPVLER